VGEKKLYTMEITVMGIITVVQPVTALGRGIGVLLQIISYQLVIGRVKIYGLRVVVEKVAQEDEDAKVYLGDHTLLFVSPVPIVVSLLFVSPVPIVVSLLFVSPVPI
jgi:hypothetical protein